jgi:hypothetical protein
MSAADQPTARFARRSTRGVLLGLSALRLASVAAAVVMVLVGLLSGAGGVGLLIGLVLAAPFGSAAFVRVGGQPAVEWTPVVTAFLTRRLTGQTEYVAKIGKPRPAGTLALPGDAASLRFHLDAVSGACMIHDPHRQTLSAVLHVTHPAYVLLGPDSQRSRVSAWGRVLAGLAASGTCSAIQITESTIPDSGRGIAEWYAQHRAQRGGWAEEQYETLLGANSVGASTHRTTITLSLDMKAAGRQIKASGGGIAGAAHVLRGDITALEFGLRSAELTFAAWMNESEIAHIVRSAYDPALDGEFTANAPGANLSHAGPLAVSEQWDRVRHDSGWSTVLWVSEWPRIEVPAHFLHAIIFTPGVRKTFSLTARPKGTADALRQIRRQKTEMIADASQKAKVGQIADLSDAQEFDDVVARERALISGHADVDFTGLVVVTAASEEQLDAAARQVERAASQAGCEIRVLCGRQSQSFATAALPLGRSAL